MIFLLAGLHCVVVARIATPAMSAMYACHVYASVVRVGCFNLAVCYTVLPLYYSIICCASSFHLSINHYFSAIIICYFSITEGEDATAVSRGKGAEDSDQVPQYRRTRGNEKKIGYK
jgi:hypothetical protein